MTTLPLFSAAVLPVETEPEKASFTLSLDYTTATREGDLPLVNILSKVFVNGKQIGLISSLDIQVRADEVFPKIVVRIGEGVTKEMVPGCSADLKAAAQRYIAELRRFPFIQVESPFIEETETTEISTI